MKKIIALLLALLLSGLAACSDGKPADPSTSAARSTTGADTTAATTTAVTTTAETVPTTQTEAPASTEAPVTEPSTEAVTEPSTEPSTEAPTESAAPTVDPWSLMGESSFEQGSYTDENGNSYSYSYALPCLTADTADAKAINAEIDGFFGAMVREQLEGIQSGLSLSLLSVGYYGEVRDSVLSLVVIGHWDWSFDDYRVYCYDAATGSRLDTAAMLKKMGISEQDFLAACRTQFRAYFENMYKAIPADQRESYGYNDALARADSDEFVNMDLMAYPDANGDIVVIAPIVSLAGADYYYHPINLGLN